MLFIDAKAQVLRRIKKDTSPPVLENKTHSLELVKEYQTGSHFAELIGPQRAFCDYRSTPIWPVPSESAMRHSQFISYLVARIDGPMETICRSQLAPSSHGDSLQQMARKQAFVALATTFFGLAHAQPSLVHYGRQLYLQALNMVNTALGNCGSTEVSEALSSVVALCLHEVNKISISQKVFPINCLGLGHLTDTQHCSPLATPY
jgi:hypothetical protein